MNKKPPMSKSVMRRLEVQQKEKRKCTVCDGMGILYDEDGYVRADYLCRVCGGKGYFYVEKEEEHEPSQSL